MNFKLFVPFFKDSQKDLSRKIRQSGDCSTNQELNTLNAVPDDKVLEEFCEEHCDGIYTLGCLSSYVSCSSKVGYIMLCPKGLILDVDSQECLSRERVISCYGNSAAVPSVAHGAAASLSYNSYAEATSLEYSCAGKEFGFQSERCASTSFACVFGIAILYTRCPSSQVFNPANASCQLAASLPACNSGLVETESPGLATSSSSSLLPSTEYLPESSSTILSTTSTAFGSSVHVNDKMIAFPCTGKEDGLYGEMCDKEVVGCFDGAAVVVRCPQDFVFDAASRMCAEKNRLRACIGTLETVTVGAAAADTAFGSATFFDLATTVADTIFSSETTTTADTIFDVETTSLPKITTTPMPAIDCDDLEDGIYGGGCMNQSVACIKGKALVFIVCPAMMLDSVSGSCKPKDKVSSCSPEVRQDTAVLMQSATPIQQTKIGNQTQNSGIELKGTLGASSEPLMLSCSDVPDGSYGNTCDTEFYACVGGNAVLMKCPEGFAYDVSVRYCVAEDTIQQCQEASPSSSAEGAVVTANTTGFSCEFLPDGMYGRGCSTEFSACVAGSVIPMMCPASLKYDEVSVKCLAAVDVPACAGTEQQPIIPGEEEAAPVVSRPPVVQSTSPMQSAVSCEGSPNGMYGEGCSSEFHACILGSALPMRCPGLQKFDEVSKQCAGAAQVAACGGMMTSTVTEGLSDELQPTSTSLFGSSSPEFSCGKLPDGPYLEGCSSHVTLCLAGKEIIFACNKPLKYDTASFACLPEEAILACQAGNSTEQERPVSSSIVENAQFPAPVRTMAFTCIGKPDGAYNEGCSTDFVICTSGLASYYRCPAPLKYDRATETCQNEDLVSACKEQAFTTMGSIQSALPVSNQFADCTGRPDGPVSFGCSSDFMYCINGQPSLHQCPNNLKFDMILQKCLEQGFVEECAQQPAAFGSAPGATMSAEVNVGQEDVTTTIMVPVVYLVLNVKAASRNMTTTATLPVTTKTLPVTTATVEQTEEVTGNSTLTDVSTTQTEITETPEAVGSGVSKCAGKPNGAYADGCSSVFYICINENVFFLYCRNSTKFDEGSGQCAEPEKVSACAESAVGSAAGRCAEVEDGVYEDGQCSQTFSVCIDGTQKIIHCCDDCVYQNSNYSCVNKEFLPECQAAPFQGAQQQTSDCEGHSDGLHVDGCSSEFYACVQGRKVQMRCPGVQRYDSESKQCLPEQYVKACGASLDTVQAVKGARPPSPLAIEEGLSIHKMNASGAVQPSVSSSVQSNDIPELFPAAPFVKSCDGLPDGKYARGCSSEFVICLSGLTKLGRCPSGLLKYCSTTQQCLPASFVKECGGNLKAANQSDIKPVLIKPEQSAAFGSSAPSVVQESETVCEGKPDGKYAKGCSAEFVACSNGQQNVLRCPGSLVFDETVQQCRAASYLAACGGVESSTTQTTEPNTFAARQSVTTAVPEPKRVGSQLFSTASCQNKPAGTYVEGCSSIFYVCDGIETFYECANGLVYDVLTQSCAPKEQVAECGGVAPVSPVLFGSVQKQRPISFGEAGVTEEEETTATISPSAFTCSKLSDGFYAKGCSANFILCLSGHPLQYTCPNGTSFDGLSEACLVPAFVHACGEEEQLTTASTAAFGTPGVEDAAIPVVFSITDYANHAMNPTLCPSAADGIYKDDCASDFVVCLNKTAVALHCANSLKYDEGSGMCVDESKLPACTASWPIPTVSPALPGIQQENATTLNSIDEADHDQNLAEHGMGMTS